MREREVKLTVPANVTLPSDSSLVGDLGEWSVQEIDQHARYFDTPDLTLTRAGASLRYRSDDGWTVKLPRARAGATFDRDELHFEGQAEEPPAAAVDVVSALTRTRPLSEVAQVHTRRHAIRLHDEEQRLVLEVAEDDVDATDTWGTTTHFLEVEVESKEAADPKLVETLVRRLRKAGAEATDAMPKIARALGARAAKPPDLTTPAIGRSATLEELVRHSIGDGVQRLIEHDPAVRLDIDDEGVHQARVATRRLRSDLRTFRPVIDRTWSEPLRSELRWLGELLGRVRDADVLLGHLGAKCDCLDEDDDRDELGNLINRLREARRHNHDLLLDAMRSPRYLALLDNLVEAARSPRIRGQRGDVPAAHEVSKLIRRPQRRLRDHIRNLAVTPSNGDLHEARKLAKQARYALEAAAPVVGNGATREARRLAALQDVLGDHQDTVVAGTWLRDASRDGQRPETAFVAGRVAGLFDNDRRSLRAKWRSAWHKVDRHLLPRANRH